MIGLYSWDVENTSTPSEKGPGSSCSTSGRGSLPSSKSGIVILDGDIIDPLTKGSSSVASNLDRLKSPTTVFYLLL